jgi:ABC-type sugar transport system substrate-binding protein
VQRVKTIDHWRRGMRAISMRRKAVRWGALGSALALTVGGLAACGGGDNGGSGGGGGGGGDVTVGLITKTETNPFFVKMKEGAQAEAKRTARPFSPSPARRMATTRAKSRRSRT